MGDALDNGLFPVEDEELLGEVLTKIVLQKYRIPVQIPGQTDIEEMLNGAD